MHVETRGQGENESFERALLSTDSGKTAKKDMGGARRSTAAHHINGGKLIEDFAIW